MVHFCSQKCEKGEIQVTKSEIVQLIKEHNIKFIHLQFTDIFGELKSVAIPESQLDKALNNKCMFDGSSIEGFVRIEESDMYLRPDINTFTLLPWHGQENKVARLICDVYEINNKPFEGDPRNILRRALSEAEKMGYTFNVGPECEFFLFEKDEYGNATNIPTDNASYFDLGPIDNGGENVRRDMCVELEKMGFEIEASHHENAGGQHEIDFKYAEALTAADNIMTFKLVVKSIADKHGLHATFMPKPMTNSAGSGMHLNMSLCKNGENAFVNEKDELGLSKDAYSFIAGLLSHAKALAAITNPLVNSYKRLVPGYEAPVYIAWSARNRSPLIRIPSARGMSTRIELRNPDPSANPYLALAVALMAGLDGIKKGLTPPPPIESNLFKMTNSDRTENHIDALPADLNQAILALTEDKLMQKTLGEHTYGKYVEAKTLEWEAYRSQVHQWELDQYLV